MNTQTVNVKNRNRSRRKTSRSTILITLVFIISFFFLLSTIGNLNSYGDGELQFEYVFVQAGDTLWTIAESFTPDNVDVRETLSIIKSENNLTGSIIHPGDMIKVPQIY